jgi:hypothetical protein
MLTAALAPENSYQPSLLDVKLPFLNDFPFMKTILTQGFTFMLL